MADIQFRQIPGNVRIPGVYFELDPSKANTAQQNQRTLIIGQITASGVATPNVPILSTGISDAITQGGAGSLLALLTQVYRQNDPFGEVWYLPVADNGGGVQATGSIAFTGPATAAGVLSLYIGGVDPNGSSVQVAVTSGMTANALATAVAAACTANPNLPVTTAVDGSVASKVDFTAKHKGLVGNDIDIRLNYKGAAGGESTPAGIVATIVAMSGGTLNPVLTTALANLADKAFDFIVHPYSDSVTTAALTAFLGDAAGRWNWTSQIYGHAFSAIRGSASALTTFGLTLNDQHQSFMGFYDSPSGCWAWAAAVAGAAAVSLRADPGVPCQYLKLNGVLSPPTQSRFLAGVRNGLLFDGISTFNVVAGVCQIENLITTYQLNAQSLPDNSYLEIETMFSLMGLLRGLTAFLVSNFASSKLAADGTRFAPGAAITTPGMIKAAIVAWYQGQVYQGNAQQTSVFAAGLIVQQNATNPSRVDVLFDPILIQQLRTLAVLTQFRLQ